VLSIKNSAATAAMSSVAAVGAFVVGLDGGKERALLLDRLHLTQ